MASKAIKKIVIISISFVAAVVLLFISNVIFVHLFVAKTILFPPQPKIFVDPQPKKISTKEAAKSKEKKKKNAPPKVTVYVPPTREDLESLWMELEQEEASDPPLQVTVDEDGRRSTARVRSILSSTEDLWNRRDEELKAAKVEVGELKEAYASFEERLEQETSRDMHRNEEMAKNISKQLTFLRSVLRRASFKDLGRKDTEKTLRVAMGDIQWLIGEEGSEGLFYNIGDALLNTLVGEKETKSEADGAGPTCNPAYLALDEGVASTEFNPPTKTVAKKPKANEVKPSAPPISNDTLRESHLHALVKNVKNALSRRDLSSYKLYEKTPIPNPVNQDSVEEIRATISPMVSTVRTKWDKVLAQEANMRDYWIQRIQALRKTSVTPGNDRGGAMCASSELVESMVAEGLESFQRRDHLQQSLVNSALRHVGDDPEAVLALVDAMRKVEVEEIVPGIVGNDVDGGGREATSTLRRPSPRSFSSWTVGRKSIYYVVDGPLLHRGIAGLIDSFADAVAGYNDHVDALMDWAVDEEGVPVGTMIVDTFFRMVRKAPFPDSVYQIKKAGIFAGRMRMVLEK